MSGRRTANMSLMVDNNIVELNFGGNKHTITRPASISSIEWTEFWEGADETNTYQTLPTKKKK